eukprot:TRINITY_DN74949_c0_g1_i1.p1 TRINITY_DN74949_c0_g1~~TRINITY_DN74949_c0_g1_i1.p1  ORF type:complete len:103 (-),score=15.04 TRINITY_DN74949_c0_g1_i1:261-569(-)
MLRLGVRQLAKNYKPLGSRVLVRRNAQKTQTAAGILIPEAATKKINEGMVAAVGPDVEQVKVGDQILLPEWGGVGISLGSDANQDASMWLFKAEDILAIIEE